MIALWDVLGVLAVIAVFALALVMVALLAAIDDERWWRDRERDHGR